MQVKRQKSGEDGKRADTLKEKVVVEQLQNKGIQSFCFLERFVLSDIINLIFMDIN